MRPGTRMSFRVFGGAAGWGTLAAVTLLGLGGAASRPDGLLLGAPSLMQVLVVLVGVGVLAALAGLEAGRPCLGLLPVLLLLLSGLPLPGLHALSGPPLLALALAGVVSAFAQTRLPLARVAFFPVVLVVYMSVAARVQAQVGPEGDEPHYLMVADSLVRDHDLDLERDYLEGRYRAFHPADLAPHYRVRGKEGEIYSLHALGLSLLILPAYALGGYPAVSFFMALLAALLAREVRALLNETWDGVPSGVAWIVALVPPLVHYAGLIFTEVPAALIVTLALRHGRTLESRRRGATVLLGLAIAFLPWLNVRYAALAVLLLLYAIAGRARPASVASLVAPIVASAAALAAYHHALYGFFDPRRVYGTHPELSLGLLPEGLQGLLLDQEFGLLVYAPLFALALPGLISGWRRRPRLVLVSLGMIGVVLLTAGSWPMWRGGFNPPGRFLVPLLPVLALGTGARLRRGLGSGIALLVGWSLWIGLAGAAEPRLVHRDRDGTAPLFRERSGAEEWTRLLPAYVLSDPDRHRLALVWGIALAAALLGRGRNATPGTLALALVGLGAAAGTASSLSHAVDGGRGAVRLVGRAALEVPGFRVVGAAEGRWGPADLAWGALYEPHRRPEGAELGSRLNLPAGTYRLTLEADDLAPRGPAPQLEVRPERVGSPRRSPFQNLERGWAAPVIVLPGERAVTLALVGGRPLVVRYVSLNRSTF